MSNPSQESRLLVMTTVLEEDLLLVYSIEGTEGISQINTYRVEAYADNDANVDFGQLIGSTVWVGVALDRYGASGSMRRFTGIVTSITRGPRGSDSTAYTLHLASRLWFTTRTTRSRIFQQMTVPDILAAVLSAHSPTMEISPDTTFEPRDYCVQYRESDFDFMSRLMEEEGIFYFYRYSDTAATLVISNQHSSHQALPVAPTLSYQADSGGDLDDDVVYAWEKSQSLRSGKVTLWDHTFELPHKNLEAQSLISDTLAVGDVTHKLKVAGNENLELYDYPGGYAGRFDGVTKSGGDQASELQKIYTDNTRTADVRMQQEAVNSIVLAGSTNFYGVIPGYKFTLDSHFEDNDTYVFTRCHFSLPQMGLYGAGDEPNFAPEVSFHCIPIALPFSPQRVTAKPVVHGTQTAVVVGPEGDEIFTDKYGRIKVQFLWDRAVPYSADSSCWVRCVFPWAGKNFGFISIPRIGHEVVIAFQEGDPDQPICIGSVYNADTMPPWVLPDNKTQSGIQTRTSGGGQENLNVLQFEDKKRAEFVFLQAEKDFHTRVKKDSYSWFGQDFHRYIDRDLIEEIKNDVHRMIKNNLFEEVKTNVKTKIGGTQDVNVVGNFNLKADANLHEKIGGNHVENTTGDANIKAANINLEASSSISLKVGGSMVVVDNSGVNIKGTGTVYVSAAAVNINSGSGTSAKSAATATAASITAPKAFKEAMKSGKTDVITYTAQAQNAPSHTLPPTGTPPTIAKVAAASAEESKAAQEEKGAAPAEKQPAEEKAPESHYIEVEVKDADNLPVGGEYVEILTPEGTRATGSTDEKGYLRVDGIQPGNATVRFPNRDKSVVE